MAEAARAARSGKVVIRNVGLMLSGDLAHPILDADTVVIEDGLITQVGKAADCDLEGAARTVDARGVTLAPGLIDSHVHPVFGDWTPRQSQLSWIESNMHGGVTSMVSAGEVHLPGRPKDVVGVKALAITAQRAFDNMRAAGVGGGVKVHAGAPVLEQGMTEDDFREMAEAGVRLLGEVGLGSVKAGDEAKRMVAWARKYGIQSTIHTGGPSIPGSGLIDADTVLEADADVIGHINGGHTALPYKHVCRLCEQSSRAIEIVHNGNERVGILTARHARELKCPHRVILGPDAPAGSGVQPLGILRLIALLSSMAEIPAEEVFCYATGNTARLR
ncbi:MAG: Enamidase, partial [Burkholderiales bacterium]